jgi:AcrR family transcriptional regulator
MSTAYELTGRTEQKQRTRAALVVAARELVAAGHTPTVEAAADAAAVSRATAYRYFPNQRALLAAAHPETAVDSLLPPDAPADPEQRLELVVRRQHELLLETEAQLRTMLRLSLDGDVDTAELPLRQGRVIPWLTEALEPLRGRLGDAELHRLVLAIRSATGVEALVWLVDVGGLDRDEAVELMRSNALAIYRDAAEQRS